MVVFREIEIGSVIPAFRWNISIIRSSAIWWKCLGRVSYRCLMRRVSRSAQLLIRFVVCYWEIPPSIATMTTVLFGNFLINPPRSVRTVYPICSSGWSLNFFHRKFCPLCLSHPLSIVRFCIRRSRFSFLSCSLIFQFNLNWFFISFKHFKVYFYLIYLFEYYLID